MIKNSQPISLAEVKKYLDEKEELSTNLNGFINKFTSMTAEQAEKLRDELRGLNLIKLKEENITKLIDLLPEEKEDLNKIFIDVGLDENEATQILNKIKEFK